MPKIIRWLSQNILIQLKVKFNLVGMLLGLSAILGGQYLEGGSVFSLFNGPALIIVLGGTLGAIFVETSWDVFKQAVLHLRWLWRPPQIDCNQIIEQLVVWSNVAKREGVLRLEDICNEQEISAFTRRGLQMLIDGRPVELIVQVLSQELEMKVQQQLRITTVYAGMGGYSPTIGIIGAILGLIKVMNNLQDPSALGPGIAVAFVATIYGVALANLCFLPIAKHLKNIIIDNSKADEIIVEGLLSIARGEHSSVMKIKLNNFLLSHVK